MELGFWLQVLSQSCPGKRVGGHLSKLRASQAQMNLQPPEVIGLAQQGGGYPRRCSPTGAGHPPVAFTSRPPAHGPPVPSPSPPCIFHPLCPPHPALPAPFPALPSGAMPTWIYWCSGRLQEVLLEWLTGQHPRGGGEEAGFTLHLSPRCPREEQMVSLGQVSAGSG